MLERLGKSSSKMFGGLVDPYVGYFDSLKEDLRKAEMAPPLREYLSVLVTASLIAFITVIVVGSLFITFLIPSPVYSYTLSIILSLVAAGATFFLGTTYPSLKSKGIQKEIEKGLPFATFYMATIASSGVGPLEVFKVLSLREGKIGKEARKIYNNVTNLGANLTVAMQKTAQKTPSPGFADLLWGMTSVITSGGDLEAYLKSKTATLMSKYRRDLGDYAKAITLYTEIYITLIIVGSLFSIIMISIISPMTGMSTLFLQTFLIFFFIPLVSIAFMVLLKGVSPTE